MFILEFARSVYHLVSILCIGGGYAIHAQWKLEGGESLSDSLPKLPSNSGADTDILISAKYFCTHPREVWKSKSGLAVFDSPFVSQDGTTGIVYGLHKKFSLCLQ